MGNEMKNVARGFKFLWATFSKIMGNVFYCCPWVVPVVRGLSVGCAYRLHPRLCAAHRAAVWVTHED